MKMSTLLNYYIETKYFRHIDNINTMTLYSISKNRFLNMHMHLCVYIHEALITLYSVVWIFIV